MTATYLDPIAWEESLPIRPSSPAWRATIRALYGTPLAPDEHDLFVSLAGIEPPVGGASELLAVVGRRGGKSETIARLGVFEALLGGHQVALAPGQVGLVAVISPLREQSQEILGYARGLARLPQVAPHVVGEARDGIEFRDRIALRVLTADAVAVSGPTVVCVIRDEWAKWPGDGAVCPDREIEASLRPAAAPVVGAPTRRFIGISSAYIRDGLCYETDAANYGRADSDVLVVRGPTEVFNPAIDRTWLAREERRSPRTFAREYLAEWQDAVTDGYFADVLERSIDKGRASSAGSRKPNTAYVVAQDPAWLRDNWGIAVAHGERTDGEQTRVIVDYVDAVSPAEVGSLGTTKILEHRVRYVARGFEQTVVLTDQAQAQSLGDIAKTLGLHLEYRPWTATNKASTFAAVYAAMRDGRVRLPDDPALIREFSSIGTRLLRSGHEQIEARSGHDDRVSAVVMAVAELLERPQWTRADYQEALDANRRLAVGGGGHFGTGWTPTLLMSGFGDFSPSPWAPPPVRREPLAPTPPPPHQDPEVVAAREAGPYRVVSPIMLYQQCGGLRPTSVLHQPGEIIVLTAADAQSAGDAVEPVKESTT